MQQQENLISRLQTLPNNLILVGEKYSGKKTLVNEVAPDFYWVDKSVEAIRALENSNCVFADIDDWSTASYSAMLKLLEENEDYHIILTCKNIMNLPRSIQSRCIIERMEPYKNIGHYCDNIGQLQFFSEDMLKAVDTFSYDEKFDLDVFFTVLCNRLLERVANDEPFKKAFYISCKYNTQKSLKSLNKKQFILNWTMDLKGQTDGWKRF